jgi:cyclopropane fatty-acyl-phospholipid synthase-like methyltransferase
MSENIRRRYNEYVRTAAPGDFLSQVRRTLDGKPVPAEQVELIVDRILTGLLLVGEDTVLDLCCGNGVLSDRIFERCLGGTGVDISDELIAVAHENFERLPERRYIWSDVVDYVQNAQLDREFTKAFCYGSLPHLTDDAVQTMLAELRRRCPTITRAFIGNLPDKAHMMEFYYEDAYVPGMEDDPETSMGIWRTQDEFSALAESAGWSAELLNISPGYYAAYYRYDAILTPNP